MSMECAECERDLRGGHDPACSRYKAPPDCPRCGEPMNSDEGWECINSACRPEEITDAPR